MVFFFAIAPYSALNAQEGNNMPATASDSIIVVPASNNMVKLSTMPTAVKVNPVEEIQYLANENVLEAFNGRATGLHAASFRGSRADVPFVTIHGLNSILFNNEPLVIVDGIWGVSPEDIDLADVSSYAVLQDAASLAQYGSAGANGVILIFTKTGTPGTNRLRFRHSTALQTAPKPFGLMEGDELLGYYRNINTHLFDSVMGDQYLRGKEINQNNLVNTDWQDELFSDVALQHNSHMSFWEARTILPSTFPVLTWIGKELLHLPITSVTL
ncbi:MAG: TonB-dependent receptor plug domain-containing protein [Bacteroidales bacterium]|nr:TonB-dependent receptor plug domain-containing protein [Bacteroidales bacterium]